LNFQSLHLPFPLEAHEAKDIAAAYAAEICDVLQAEAFIADRRHRQMLLSARCYKLHATRLQAKSRKALAESNLLRVQSGMRPIIYPFDSCAPPKAGGLPPSEKDIVQTPPDPGTEIHI